MKIHWLLIIPLGVSSTLLLSTTHSAPHLSPALTAKVNGNLDRRLLHRVQVLSQAINAHAHEADSLVDLEAVRYYAQILMAHHTKLAVKIAELREKIPTLHPGHAPLETTADSILEGNLEGNLEGDRHEYDRSFLRSMIKVHATLMQTLQEATITAQDATLKKFFEELFYTSHYHHDLAVSLSREEIIGAKPS